MNRTEQEDVLRAENDKHKGMKLLKFPKIIPSSDPEHPYFDPNLTPAADILSQAKALQHKIRNIVIFAHMEDGTVKAFNAVDDNVGLWPFVDWIRSKSNQAVQDYLNPPSTPPNQPIGA
jgi:hypothetical protein